MAMKNSHHVQAKSKQIKKYKGVRMRLGLLGLEIRAPNQKTRIWLGSYSTPEAAARAYDAALVILKGSSAALNFPVHPPPPPPSGAVMSPKSIQRAAAAAAASADGDVGSVTSVTTTTTTTDEDDVIRVVENDSNASPSSSTVIGDDDESWADFARAFQLSPKYCDGQNEMAGQAWSAYELYPHMLEDYWEDDGEISLWS